MSFRTPDLHERQQAAATARKSALEKFKAAANDPSVAEKQAARAAIHQARQERMAEREKQRLAREAELAAQAAREAELAEQARLEAERIAAIAAAEEAERELQLAAEQKAARDARYAARKAAKKVRRRGY
ncbi:MAG: hypothetical protein FJX62_07915 [Alphaproteobacteria bacterium]|nr:hypothetical protein [Alphaproteobacteria bacterium]